MAKNKNNQAIWNTRIKKNASSIFQKVGNSIDIDKRLYKEDIQGSIAHVEMLFKQKIISFKIKNKIIYGLTKIEKEISNKKFEFNKKYEDIHMNIEKRLFQIIGEEAGYVHTARSRNDQVITDFKIWIKSSTKEINLNLDKIIRSKRSKMLRALSIKKRRSFYESQLGKNFTVLFEEKNKEGYIIGFTENYIKVRTPWDPSLVNTLHKVELEKIDEAGYVRFVNPR